MFNGLFRQIYSEMVQTMTTIQTNGPELFVLKTDASALNWF